MASVFVQIPDEWLLAPETKEAEKQVRALNQEIKKLRNAEPLFRINYLDFEGRELTKFNAEVVRHISLTTEQVKDLMEQLKEGVPIATDFGLSKPPERSAPRGPSSTLLDISRMLYEFSREFTPATEQEIVKYRDQAYPTWLKESETLLRNLHVNLDERAPRPKLRFFISNDGTRPGRDVLVSIEVSGSVLILPQTDADDDDEMDEEAGGSLKPLELPRASVAPYGGWRQKTYGSFFEGSMGRPRTPDYSSLLHGIPRHDPNALYWHNKPMKHARRVSLKCAQWRHGVAPKTVKIEVHCSRKSEQVSGLIKVHIHAENLSYPIRARLPARITVKEADTYAVAEQLVSECIRRSNATIAPKLKLRSETDNA